MTEERPAPTDWIDSHLHAWTPRPGRYPWLDRGDLRLARDRALSTVESAARATGARGAILVQADDDEADTDDLLREADSSSFVRGVIGWVPLDRPLEAIRQLDRRQNSPRFVGVRCLSQGYDDRDWLLTPAVAPSLRELERRVLTLDVVLRRGEGLAVPLEIARSHPELTVVVDHLGSPGRTTEERLWWEDGIQAAAEVDTLQVKLSGAAMMGDHPPGAARRAVDFVLQKFGPDRVMIGSDWPISAKYGDYGEVMRRQWALLAGLTPAEREQVAGGTATTAYRLDGRA